MTDEKRRTLERRYVASLDEWRGESIEILIARPFFNRGAVRLTDPKVLRAEFFDLEEKTVGLLDFLNRYGLWRLHFNRFGAGWTPVIGTSENPFGSLIPRQPEHEDNLQIVTPDAIWRDRSQLRERIRTCSTSLSEWFTTSKGHIVLEPVEEFPFYSYTVRCAGDTVEASIGFDLLQGSHFALCGRLDCARPFEVTRKSKQYCSHECAHLEVVRRSRRPRTPGKDQ